MAVRIEATVSEMGLLLGIVDGEERYGYRCAYCDRWPSYDEPILQHRKAIAETIASGEIRLTESPHVLVPCKPGMIRIPFRGLKMYFDPNEKWEVSDPDYSEVFASHYYTNIPCLIDYAVALETIYAQA